MTELYRPGTGKTAEPEADPAHDTGEYSGQARYETTPGSDHSGTGTRTTPADDELPTRQDARAATWGENPEYHDENDPDTGYDGDLDALTADDYALDSDQDDLDQAAGDQDAPAATGPDAPPAEPPGSMAAAPAEQDERSPAGAGERITELEAENAQQAKSISDLQVRLERLEQGNQERPAAGIPDRARDVDNLPGETTERQHGRRLPSDARLALGGTVAGIALTTAAEHMSTGSGHMMEYLGGALSVGIGAIAVWRENRKKDVRRPGN